MSMQILVTGSRGFIGGALKLHLERAGHTVYGTVHRSTPGDREFRLDLTRAEAFKGLPDIPFDALIHAAGMMNGDAVSPETMRINAGGTRRMVAYARRIGCRHFIQVSSITVYGLRAMEVNRSENTTPRSLSAFGTAYMRSKAEAEVAVEKGEIPYTILRLPSVLGAGDSWATPKIVKAILQGSVPYLVRRDRRFSILNIRNLADIVERTVELGPLGDAFNCADHAVSWEELVQHYAACLRVPFRWRRDPLHRPVIARDDGYAYLAVNSLFGAHFPSDRLWTRLGFTPKHSWAEAVEDAVRSYAGKVAQNQGPSVKLDLSFLHGVPGAHVV